MNYTNLFHQNCANFDSVGKSDTYGGAIYYVLDKISESSNNNDKLSLSIGKCTFTNNHVLNEGGSIFLLIRNAQSSRSIEIYDSVYEFTPSEVPPVSDNGGFISYSVESSSATPSNNNPPLHINNCSFSSNIDRFSNNADHVERGGCLYFNIQNSWQTGTIEINDCKFNHVISSASESFGGSIYFTSNAASSSTSSYKALSIKNCEFSDSNVKNLGGSIYIQFENDESQKQVEISGCKFQRTSSNNNKDAVYIKSNQKFNTVKFYDCTFESCMLYLETLSATLENCHFTNIAADKNAIYYKNSPAEDFETSTISVDKCDFTQTESKVDSLVYFETKLSSKFSFTSNTIKFLASAGESHVLGCKENLEIQEEKNYWTFSNNDLDPQEETYIKTSHAEKIPAYCMTGFTCIPIPKNCDDNYRCELLEPGQFSEQKIVLNDQVYENLNTTLSIKSNHGGSIRLTNYILECKGSTFTNCKAENGGGGGIYIVVNSADIKEASYVIEKCTFDKCMAKFGGGIYIYNNQQTCEFTIKKCTFNNNNADTTSVDDNHLFGGSAIYLQTKTGKVIRCNFKGNTGSGVKIYHEDGLSEPEDSVTSSLKLKSEDDEHSIQIKNCFFETDKHSSSSSLFYVRKGKKKFSVNVVGNTFAGELPNGSYHIDGESVSDMKNDVLKMKIENNKFESEKKLALNSKLNVLSFDVNKQQFNYKEESMRKNRNNFNSIVVVAVTVSAIVVISMSAFVIIKKRRNSQEKSSTDDNENNLAEL